MNEAKNYIIRILNDQYTLSSDESQDHINRSSELVNLFMREIIDRDKQTEHKRVAILAALRMASHILHLESRLNEMACKEAVIVSSLTLLDEQLSALGQF